jgi:hypothetical protein
MKFCAALHRLGRANRCASSAAIRRPCAHKLRRSVTRLVLTAATLVIFAFNSSAGSPVSDLKLDETILFYPTLAAPAEKGGWDVRIHGCVYELERRRFTLAGFRTALRLDGIKLNEAQVKNFNTRGRLFCADNERNHRVVIRIGDQTFELGKSAPSGHFEKEIHLDALPETNAAFLSISAVLKPDDAREFKGVAMIVPATGLSVVSDIDDTIKISDVLNRSALIRRTFLEQFEAVPGMADVYRSWATNGALFHYVSASPWQLYLPLVEFARTNGFLQGSWNMRQWRLKDRTFKSIFEKPDDYKIETITPLLHQFPQRRFVLVGDSGEHDPEVYAALARKFPLQVAAIFIRDVTGQGAAAERYRTNFSGLPDGLWRVFKTPSEIAPLLPR